jgi:FixJ family two-component response regulator
VTFDAAQIGKPSNECMCVLRSGRRGRREKGNSRHLVWLLRADFLRSRHLSNTACLVADVHMPGLTEVELHRHLVDAGYAIPTILVTAYPDEVVRDQALKDGIVCYLSKPVDDDCLERCLRSALQPGTPIEDNS